VAKSKDSVKVYENMSYEEYEQKEGFRQSWFNYLADYPKSLRWHLDHRADDDEDTNATIIGNAVDVCLTTPEQFELKYTAGPNLKRNTKEGKNKWEEFLFTNPGKILLKSDDYLAVTQMVESIKNCHTASALLEGARPQLVICWTDESTKIKCKARIDGWNDKLKTGFDIKTTRSVRMFRKALEDYGYHRQAAWYLEALSQAGVNPEHFCFVAVDKTPPYGVMVFRLSDRDVQLAKLSCHQLLATYQECVANNVWPGYPDEMQDIELTDWARLRLLGGIENG
jgi:hypothetical protein